MFCPLHPSVWLGKQQIKKKERKNQINTDEKDEFTLKNTENCTTFIWYC